MDGAFLYLVGEEGNNLHLADSEVSEKPRALIIL